MTPIRIPRLLLALAAAGTFVALVIAWNRVGCLRTRLSKGITLDQCPSGELQPIVEVEAPRVLRGASADVTVRERVLYTVGAEDERHEAPVENLSAEFALVGPAGEQALALEKALVKSDRGWSGTLKIPMVPDGDYRLRVKAHALAGEATVDVPLAFYTPARAHVLTDRPLYEPGHTVQFRALALRASDLAPLEGRQGKWVVRDPNDEVLLEEAANAGAWGVAAGSFPIDKGAPSGTWSVTWESGALAEKRSFEVKPFTIPRFRVEANAGRPFYRKGERPRIEGTVRYASGAPVAGAKVALTYAVLGDWPPPTSWSDGSAFPKEVVTNANGALSVELPPVPDDLQDHVQVQAVLAVSDSTGDRVEASAKVLLAEDAIAVSSVTELGSGLAQGFNNRVYLRATTADGRALPGATVVVKRLWEATDTGTEAVADEDGVASVQLDPGPPVNIVVPAKPFRLPPKEKAVRLEQLRDLLHVDAELSLAESRAFGVVTDRLERCVRYAGAASRVQTVSFRVRTSGAVEAVSSGDGPLGACVVSTLSGSTFAAGDDRLYVAGWTFDDSGLATIAASIDSDGSAPGDLDLEAAFRERLLEARACLPPTVESGPAPFGVTWVVDTATCSIHASAYPRPSEEAKLGPGPSACIQGHLAGLRLSKPCTQGAAMRVLGSATFAITAPAKYEAARPQDTVMTGYEFLVTAKQGTQTLGSTKLRLREGEVPPLRLRASAQWVNPGEKVDLALLRGPTFTGTLPEKLELRYGTRTKEIDLDKSTRSARLTVPEDFEGWASVAAGDARVVLFVRGKNQVAVAVSPEHPRYAPGQTANLVVATTVAGKGTSAGVGLFGVDDGLAALATLPGADELAALRPAASGAAGFSGIDAQAIAMGRVRGANAVAATLARVSELPTPAAVETPLALKGETHFDPNEALVERFYAVLAELHAQAGAWEHAAPRSEKMTPPLAAKLWGKALDAMDARKEATRDAWGRRLRLHRLPASLLALTDPRQLVVDATRLPEDIENWEAWVKKEQP